MTLLYVILNYVMAVSNLYRGLNEMNTMSYVFAVLWLCLGIIYTVKYFKEKKQQKDKE